MCHGISRKEGLKSRISIRGTTAESLFRPARKKRLTDERMEELNKYAAHLTVATNQKTLFAAFLAPPGSSASGHHANVHQQQLLKGMVMSAHAGWAVGDCDSYIITFGVESTSPSSPPVPPL